MAKILIAEDERDIRELIEFTLTAYAGHQVFKATNGQEAVEMASKVMPDLIMMDVRMPRMTGYEACKALKQIDAVKDIPVVFLSAKGQESEIDTGLDAGAYDYILKPFAPADLATRVAEILKKFEARKAAPASPTPPVTTTPEAATGSDGKLSGATPSPTGTAPNATSLPSASPNTSSGTSK
jgi:two-component system, OmpR family, alkaline phosphatase synthesis response regulator PhoP